MEYTGQKQGKTTIIKFDKAVPKFKDTGIKNIKRCLLENIIGIEINTDTKETFLLIGGKDKTIKDLGLPSRIKAVLSQYKAANDLPEDLTEINGIGEYSAEIIKKALNGK